ncbi:unnamed protein product [Hymenolepis diminuta]|uniref:Rad60-SLD_2 domain-containing protein n=1 Tax=Hymenolepis diminuta TaxID=6216 RepID=A0A0R3SQT5_HYMDI|nr:unnamed protein product [Hymenolepis diminuta]
MDLGGGSDRATNVAFQTIQRLHQMSNHSEANAESGVKKFTFFNAAVAEMEAERPERTESTLVFRGKVENDGANKNFISLTGKIFHFCCLLYAIRISGFVYNCCKLCVPCYGSSSPQQRPTTDFNPHNRSLTLGDLEKTP